MNQTPQQDRLQELDALRGIAAFAVMWFHYTIQYNDMFLGGGPYPWFTFPPGRYGVHLFFVISGFVIFLTLSRSKSWWDFAANRFSRLYPPYWVAILITFAVMSWTPLPDLAVTGWHALLNFSMLQYWLVVPPVDGVYWTLSVELAFYGFVSVLYLIGWLPKVERWIAAWLALEFIARWLELRGTFSVPPLIRTALLLEYGHYFFAGILFHRMKYGRATLVHFALLAACIGAAWYCRDLAHGIVLAVVCAIFYAFIRGWLTWIVVTPLLFLGDISYTLYLLHQHIGYAIIWRLREAGLTADGWLIVPAVACILLATLVTYIVEKPAREWIRRKWKASVLRQRLVRRTAE